MESGKVMFLGSISLFSWKIQHTTDRHQNCVSCKEVVQLARVSWWLVAMIVLERSDRYGNLFRLVSLFECERQSTNWSGQLRNDCKMIKDPDHALKFKMDFDLTPQHRSHVIGFLCFFVVVQDFPITSYSVFSLKITATSQVLTQS